MSHFSVKVVLFLGWKFYFNTAGTELPLKSINQISKAVKDTNVNVAKINNQDRTKKVNALYRQAEE